MNIYGINNTPSFKGKKEWDVIVQLIFLKKISKGKYCKTPISSCHKTRCFCTRWALWFV